jgi:hypothetical protein
MFFQRAFILLIIFFGISKDTKALDYVVHEKYIESQLVVADADSVEDVFHENGKKSKHSKLTAPFVKSNVLPIQYRTIVLDFCNDFQISSFNLVSFYMYNPSTYTESDLIILSLPLFKLFNNYRI